MTLSRTEKFILFLIGLFFGWLILTLGWSVKAASACLAEGWPNSAITFTGEIYCRDFEQAVRLKDLK